MKEQILTKEEITKAFAYSNFGESSREDVIKYSLLKYASGYSTGRTAKVILIELGLLSVNEKLTVKGKRYLFDAFCDGNSF